MDTTYIWTGDRVRVGYVVPSIMNTCVDPKTSKYQDLIRGGNGWLKDWLLEENNIPANVNKECLTGPEQTEVVYNPVIRLSKEIFRKPNSKSVLTRYKNGREYIYVLGQLESPETFSGIYKYDFVESGFFNEEDWLDYQVKSSGELPTYKADWSHVKFTEEKTDDDFFDRLKDWVRYCFSNPEERGNSVMKGPKFGIAMYNWDNDVILSFLNTNNPGEPDKSFWYLINSSSLSYNKDEEECSQLDALESLWVYKYLYSDYYSTVPGSEWSNWFKFPIKSNIGKHHNNCYQTKLDIDTFIIISPKSAGYIAYSNGTIRLNLYKSIIDCDYAVNYTLDEKISVAKSILLDEYRWCDLHIEEGIKSIPDPNIYREKLDDISSVIELLEGHIGLFSEVTEDLSPNRSGITNILSDEYENDWIFEDLVRSGNYVPVPEGVNCKVYDVDGKELRTLQYNDESLYAMYRTKFKNLHFPKAAKVVFTDTDVMSKIKGDDGWLKDGWTMCPCYHESVPGTDINYICNLPNVTEEKILAGDYMYRQIQIHKDRILMRDIWYNCDEDAENTPYTLRVHETDEVDMDDDWDDDEDENVYNGRWSYKSLSSIGKEFLEDNIDDEYVEHFNKLIPFAKTVITYANLIKSGLREDHIKNLYKNGEF